MCWLLSACTHREVIALLNDIGVFVVIMTAIVTVGVIVVARAKAKRTGIDMGELDYLIEQARRHGGQYDDRQ